jgi:hypothetical protein
MLLIWQNFLFPTQVTIESLFLCATAAAAAFQHKNHSQCYCSSGKITAKKMFALFFIDFPFCFFVLLLLYFILLF